MDDSPLSRRKSDHLRIAAEKDVSHRGTTLLEGVRLMHQPLPELDLEQVKTVTELFGKPLAAPLIISGMSGGTAQSRELNRDLARAAGRAGVALSVGSQRVLLTEPGRLQDFAVRPFLGDGVLLANIGGAQLAHLDVATLADLAARIEADGLCVHLNVAQELCQPEGDRCFVGQLEGIARLAAKLPGRVMVKETGAGMAPRTLELLRDAGVACVDVAGAGGTSFTRVEMLRHEPGSGPDRELAETLADWGVPTAVCIVAARAVLGPQACVVGSGGIRTGLDWARALAAGASLAAVARPLLLAWREAGEQGASALLGRLVRELRAVMLLTGCRDLGALRAAPRIYVGELAQWLGQLGLMPPD